MPLSIGDKLGHYEILGPLGAGGMGEVYKARDAQLEREVAIKVLPQALARDPERLARFDREAKILAALNHPNIAVIYGLVESDGQRALAMELVPGETLGAHIKRGAMLQDEALRVAKQMAEALEAAHERGVTHRDLKPGNVMITPTGLVKVLDFGLASITQSAAPGNPDNSPTLTMGMTQAGAIMGTAAYMSPEQAAGAQVDRRADIWSFGVVLWEMLTGKRLFGDGESISHTLADVLRAPVDLEPIPVGRVRRLLKRCLDRSLKTRLQSIAEARILIDEILAGGAAEETSVAVPSTSPAPPESPIKKWTPWTVAALALAGGAALAAIHFRETPPVQNPLRYTVATPENSFVQSFAVSPDGRYVVIAVNVGGKPQLWLRALNTLQAQPMPFTEDGTYPFWSPDSRNIGFFAQGKLKRVPVTGGPSQSLCDVPNGRGGSWSREDVIVFSPTTGVSAIQRVAAGGGPPSDVNKAKGDQRHPLFLPDGRHFLYTNVSASDKIGIYISSLDGSEDRRILADLSSAVFAPGVPGGRLGHILFVRDNTLMAQPFDAVSVQPSGDVFPVLGGDGVSLTSNNSYAPVSASENGVIVYLSGGAAGSRQMTWFDRTGKSVIPLGAPGVVIAPAISPDQKVVAYSRGRRGSISDLLLLDQASGREIRFTSDDSQNIGPVWSPKQDRIAFNSDRGGGFRLYQKAASASSPEQLLLPAAKNPEFVTQWSVDGRFIVYTDVDPKTREDIWTLPVGDGAPADLKPTQFTRSQFRERQGQISPDGHWMAYTSDESGRFEIYVRPFPSGDGVFPISTSGGDQPRWRGDSKELFYVALDGKIIAVAVKAVAGPKVSFEAGAPTPLFEPHIEPTQQLFQYDVTPDGKRFLVGTTNLSSSSQPLTVVVNPQAEWKK